MAKLHVFTCDRCDFREEAPDAISIQQLDFRTIWVGIGITGSADLCPACWGKYKDLENVEIERWAAEVLEWFTSVSTIKGATDGSP